MGDDIINARSEFFSVTYEMMEGEGYITAQADGELVPSGAMVPAGTQIEFTATASEGYAFDRWEVNGVIETRQTFTLTIEEDTLVQLWEPATFFVTAEIVQGEGMLSGEINGAFVSGEQLVPPGIALHWGTLIEVEAIPAPGYVFERWTSNIAIDEMNPRLTFMLEQDTILRAHFVLEAVAEFWVTYDVPTGGGLIIAQDINGFIHISNGVMVPTGTQIEFHAIPEEGFIFDHWTVNGAWVAESHMLPLSITIEEDTHVQAWFFAMPVVTLTYDVAQGEGTITVQSLQNGMQIFSGEVVTVGAQVQLSATPGEGYFFDQWTVNGMEMGTEPVLWLGMQEDTHAQAWFSAAPVVEEFQVTYDVAQGEGTIVARDVAGMQISSGIIVPAGTTIEFNATSGARYFFDHWTVNGAGIGTEQVLLLAVEENVHVQAWFAAESAEGEVEFAFHKTDQRVYNERRREQTAQYLLAGATFKLYQYNGENPPDKLVQPSNVGDGPNEWQVVGIETSTGSMDEPIVFEIIPERVYQMAEIVVPRGFALPVGQWRIVANTGGDIGITAVAGIAITSFIEINGARYVGNIEARPAAPPCNTTSCTSKNAVTTTDLLILSAIATTCSMKKPGKK